MAVSRPSRAEYLLYVSLLNKHAGMQRAEAKGERERSRKEIEPALRAKACYGQRMKNVCAPLSRQHRRRQKNSGAIRRPQIFST